MWRWQHLRMFAIINVQTRKGRWQLMMHYHLRPVLLALFLPKRQGWHSNTALWYDMYWKICKQLARNALMYTDFHTKFWKSSRQCPRILFRASSWATLPWLHPINFALASALGNVTFISVVLLYSHLPSYKSFEFLATHSETWVD